MSRPLLLACEFGNDDPSFAVWSSWLLPRVISVCCPVVLAQVPRKEAHRGECRNWHWVIGCLIFVVVAMNTFNFELLDSLSLV